MKKFFGLFAALMLFASFAGAVNSTPSGVPVLISGGIRVSQSTYYEPYPVSPGGIFDLWIRIDNPGTSRQYTINDVECVIVERPPFSSAFSQDDLKRYVGPLPISQVALLKYKIKVDEKAATGDNELLLRCRSEGNDWGEVKLGVSVRESNPLAEISRIKATPDEFAPGGFGKLEFVIENRANTELKNIQIKLDLSSETLPISPVSSSGEAFIRSLAPDASGTVSFDLTAGQDAAVGVYKIPVTFSYEDTSSNKYSRDSTASVIVAAPAELLIALDASDNLRSGSKGKVTISLTNRGLSDIKRATAVVKDANGFEILSTKTQYLGDIDSNDFESFDVELFVNTAEKQISIPVTVSYRDALNREKVDVVNVPVRVYTDAELTQLQLTQAGNPMGMVIVAVVLLVLGYFAYNRFFKKKA